MHESHEVLNEILNDVSKKIPNASFHDDATIEPTTKQGRKCCNARRKVEFGLKKDS